VERQPRSVIVDEVSLDGTPTALTAFTEIGPIWRFTEIHRLSHMPWDLTVKFEKPASAVFAGDMSSGGYRHEQKAAAARR
jgi:hypothetical protein